MEQLKARAKSLGLWNLFLSKEHYPDVGVPLTNLEYSVMAEIMGRCPRIAPEACNCSAPDTGNMGPFFPLPIPSFFAFLFRDFSVEWRTDLFGAINRGLCSLWYSSPEG